jgi:glycogen debranching enzyme
MRRSTARRPAAPGEPATSGGPVDDRLIDGAYDIRATSAVADIPRLVLKHDDAFLVADRLGDVPEIPDGAFGFYAEDTRFLQRLELRLEGQRPLLLNATIDVEGWESAIDLTNADVVEWGRLRLPSRTLRISRRLTIFDRRFYQVVAIESFAREALEITLSWDFAADFVDVFEVRGYRRLARGVAQPARVEASAVELPYRGRDGVVRTTRLDFEPAPTELDAATARYRLRLDPHGRAEIAVSVAAAVGLAPPARPLRCDEALARRSTVLDGLCRDWARVTSDHESFNRWVERSRSDLHLLLTATDDGFVPYAGIPWYVAPFGRDALVTALQVLPFSPEIARGTLRFLARHQGRADDPFTDQEPGKILHEYRRGELASCREIPFLPYYGSVDATPLFVMLVAEYLRWTGDLDLARDLWAAVENALAWMASHGTADEPGYLRYARRSSRGLENQGWKDSHDAVMHASGVLAPTPIAVVEAQGYQYAALLGAATVAEAIGLPERAPALRARAERLRAQFETDFWMDGEGCYALALDGVGEPCRVVSSNSGHCLWTGIASGGRAVAVSNRLMADDMFTGWGIRTLAAREILYNPMSYHNGSVWPHDTAIAALGMRRYGLIEPFLTLATALFEAVLHFPESRMPELFCGFPRRPGHGPTRYPVACEPQAWSAGVVFQLLAGMLGLVPSAAENRLTLDRPRLPAWLQWLEVHGLALGKSRVTLRAVRGREGAAVELLARDGDVELVVRR